MRASLGFVSLLAALLVGACYNDEGDYIVARAKYQCIRISECDGTTFANFYDGNMDKCRADFEDFFTKADDLADVLFDYDPDEAKECIKAARKNKTTCGAGADDEISDACDRVFH
ncbi:MAG: hypothetical protein KC420_02185 [Myxococcales bacterium]|nr:hypothetical protein [Myxococcales bacterium]MCB9568256.1 hypothetical protein [Myxococcales bacterium]MCB9704979.1 hypothetical protein [Myxococcales bacterium]